MNYMHTYNDTLCDDLFEDCTSNMEVYNTALEAVDVSDQFDVQFTEVDDEKAKSDASGSNEIQKQNWFKSLISKIRTFVKNAIGNIKIVLNRLGNKIRLKKSTKMSEKVSKLNDTSKEIHVTMSKQDMNLLSMGAKKDISSAIVDCVDRFYDLSGSKEDVSTIKKNSVAGIFPGLSSTGTLKTEQNAGGSGKFKMRVNPIVVKRYLDNAVGARGARMLTANKKITTPADMRGLKFRVPNVIGTVASWEAMGAKVIGVPLSELFTGLQNGLVDAEENPYAQIESSGFYQVQDYIMETKHQYNALYTFINEAFWQSLPAELQQVLLDANAAAWGYYNASTDADDDRIREVCRNAGVTIVPEEEIDIDAFKALIQEKVLDSDVSKDWAEGGWEYIQSL